MEEYNINVEYNKINNIKEFRMIFGTEQQIHSEPSNKNMINMYTTRKNNGIAYISELPKNWKIHRIRPASSPLAIR